MNLSNAEEDRTDPTVSVTPKRTKNQRKNKKTSEDKTKKKTQHMSQSVTELALSVRATHRAIEPPAGGAWIGGPRIKGPGSRCRFPRRAWESEFREGTERMLEAEGSVKAMAGEQWGGLEGPT